MEHAEPAGSVRVANEVIASIAAMAAREVDGVAALDEANARHFGDWIKRETAHRGVRVVLDPERKIHLEVTETEPGVRGDTVSGTTKPARVETGASVNVPLFVNQGDHIRVDTRSGSYIERI